MSCAAGLRRPSLQIALNLAGLHQFLLLFSYSIHLYQITSLHIYHCVYRSAYVCSLAACADRSCLVRRRSVWAAPARATSTLCSRFGAAASAARARGCRARGWEVRPHPGWYPSRCTPRAAAPPATARWRRPRGSSGVKHAAAAAAAACQHHVDDRWARPDWAPAPPRRRRAFCSCRSTVEHDGSLSQITEHTPAVARHALRAAQARRQAGGRGGRAAAAAAAGTGTGTGSGEIMGSQKR